MSGNVSLEVASLKKEIEATLKKELEVTLRKELEVVIRDELDNLNAAGTSNIEENQVTGRKQLLDN